VILCVVVILTRAGVPLLLLFSWFKGHWSERWGVIAKNKAALCEAKEVSQVIKLAVVILMRAVIEFYCCFFYWSYSGHWLRTLGSDRDFSGRLKVDIA